MRVFYKRTTTWASSEYFIKEQVIIINVESYQILLLDLLFMQGFNINQFP